MKVKYYYLAGAGILLMVAMLLAAIVTATGADYLEPTKRVNRMNFIWAALGLAVAVYSFWKIRRLNAKKINCSVVLSYNQINLSRTVARSTARGRHIAT